MPEVKKYPIGTWLLIPAIIALVVALSTPNLLRSRIAANESSAVGSVRTINTAAAAYSSAHPGEGYPRNLADLAPYLDRPLAQGIKSGYSFRYTAQPADYDGAVKGFRVEAVPVSEGQTGQRSFATNESGTISYRPAAGAPESKLDGGDTLQAEPQAPAEPRKMIRRGSMTLVASDPATIAENIRAVANRLGGYVESVRYSNETANSRQAVIAIRVPAARFDEVRRQVRGLSERVSGEEDDARDDTGQYVDLESNLRNFHAEEAQYLEIMRRAGSIKDTLAVAERLADVRGRIERTQGQLAMMSHQVEMALLEVTLRTEAVVQPVDVRWHPRAVVTAAFFDAADDLSHYANFVIGVAFRLPVFLLWVMTLFVSGFAGWRALRWMWKRAFPTPAAAA